MDNLYFFSKNEIMLNTEKISTGINDTKTICLQENNLQNIELSEIINNQIFSSKLSFNNNFENYLSNNIISSKIDNNVYCEIIYAGKQSPLQKFTTENCEVFIYASHVEILYKNKYYSYFFDAKEECYCFEQNTNIYILNQNNLLVFDLKIKAFCLKKCKKYAKNDKNIEILCKTPKNNTYFLHYNFDTSNNQITIKQYKNNSQLTFDNYTLPIVFFHLVKNNFDDAKLLLSNNINFDNIKNYFSRFNDIWEIDGKFLLTSCDMICNINFEIQNNLIIDID